MAEGIEFGSGNAEVGRMKQRAEDFEVGSGTRRRPWGAGIGRGKHVEAGRKKEGPTAYDSRGTAKERGGFFAE
jgi:hypothetical protein